MNNEEYQPYINYNWSISIIGGTGRNPQVSLKASGERDVEDGGKKKYNTISYSRIFDVESVEEGLKLAAEYTAKFQEELKEFTNNKKENN